MTNHILNEPTVHCKFHGYEEIGQVINLSGGKLGWAFSTIRRELQLLVHISFMPLAG